MWCLPSTITIVALDELDNLCSSFHTIHRYSPLWLRVTLLINKVDDAVWLSSSSVVILLNKTPSGTLQENINFIGASWSLVAVHVIWSFSPNTIWFFWGTSCSIGGPIKGKELVLITLVTLEYTSHIAVTISQHLSALLQIRNKKFIIIIQSSFPSVLCLCIPCTVCSWSVIVSYNNVTEFLHTLHSAKGLNMLVQYVI